MYVWLVTGSLLLGSPPRLVRGIQQPPLLCQLCPGRAGRAPEGVCVADTLVKSRLCRQYPFSPQDPTWIVLVGFWLSCRLVWWSIMSSGKLPVVDQAPPPPIPSTLLLGTFLGLALDLGSDRLYGYVMSSRCA